MTDPILYCVFEKCNSVRERDYWCTNHWGMFKHECAHNGCNITVLYDDEPYCFTHSPDSGSSFRGYSAYKIQHDALKASAPVGGSF